MKKFSSKLSALVFGALMALGMIGVSSATAEAAPIVTQIGPTGCVNGTCQGGIYTLSADFVSTNGTYDMYNIAFTVDTTSYTGGATYITAVGVKVSPQLVSATQGSVPTSVGGVFATEPGGVSNSGTGCSGSGGGFICSGVNAPGGSGMGALVSNVTNTWNWQIVIDHGSLFPNLDGSSIKAHYANWDSRESDLVKVGALVSEDMPPGGMVPEPTTYLLTGFGLVLLGIIWRYRTSA